MNDSYIVTADYMIADILKAYEYEDDRRSGVSTAEILLVAVVAAKYFQNQQERALCLLVRLGDIPHLSVSRFNRRLNALNDWLYNIVRRWTKCLPMVKHLSSTVCHSQYANGYERDAVRKSGAKTIVATVRRKKRSFSGGVYT